MKFEDLRLNKKIRGNLKKMNLETLTLIQEKTFSKIMQGKDIIGISKTGSGKSIAFILPVLQQMINMKWSKLDGLCAIFIAPTRELAIQLHETICQLSQDFLVSLSIGGTFDNDKSDCEILVGTPGRILENLEAGLSADNLRFLIVDEADKLCELGFKQAMINIVEYLNTERQTLLFSATAITDIEIFGLSNPETISAYSEDAKLNIQNFYHICSSADKLKLLYALLEREKTIVFFSTCKTAKFYFLLFSKLKLKVVLLTGNMSQNQRTETYRNFLSTEGILFCTDVGARGLDFKDVKIIIQFDCPESAETFIHRAGRTGRNGTSGINHLFLLNGERKFLETLLKVKEGIPRITEGSIFVTKNIERKVKSLIYKSKELKIFLEKYLKTYHNFLLLYKKKYDTDIEKEIKSLREIFGLL